MKLSLPGIWRRRAPGEGCAWLFTSLLVIMSVREGLRNHVQKDDAFISYRYALNLASGHGLVFNLGEHVEGFTNLLWTLLVAAGIRAGVQAPVIGRAMSLGFGALTLILLHVYIRRFLPRHLAWLAVLAPAVMLASNSFACWMTAGLETPLFVFLTLAALLAYDMKRPILTACLCVLAFLCRPEGGIQAMLLLGVPWAACVLGGNWRTPAQDWRRLLHITVPPLIFAGAVLLLTAFRIIYYHDFVPNTFHAKVGQAPVAMGWIYIDKFLNDGAVLLLPGLALGPIIEPRLRVPALFALATIAYVVSIGGDVFAFGRFLLPILPIMLAGTIATTAWLLARNRLAGQIMASMLPATAVASLYLYVPPSRASEFSVRPPSIFPYSAKREVAQIHYVLGPSEDTAVKMTADEIRHAKPGASLVAAVGIGKLGYYNMDFTILDVVGLIDRHIARSKRTVAETYLVPGHSRTDSDYVLSRKPDVILIPDITDLHPGMIPAVADLLTNPRLPQDYAFRHDGGFWGKFWVRK